MGLRFDAFREAELHSLRCEQCLLAAKISSINEIANICERVQLEVDIVEVAHAVGTDPTIGPKFVVSSDLKEEMLTKVPLGAVNREGSSLTIGCGISMKEKLIEKIRRRKASIAVIGLGRVGLLTAAMFASAGFRVIGTDINQEIVEMASSGKSHIREPGLSKIIERVVKESKLKATKDTLRAITEADITITCVQTPLLKGKTPDLTYLEKACKSVAKALSKGKLVIIESTVPPGTMKDLVAPLLERESNLECKTDFWLAYCPERMSPGKALDEFIENSRIIGGCDQESAEIARELFKTVKKGEILITDFATAEVTKLAENTFRDVNIAFANELALICEELGVDVMDVIKLANTHPRVSIHKPGCGVGGPCLPKDPYLLLYQSKEKSLQLHTTIIELSRRLNDNMPLHTVELVMDALKSRGKDIYGHKVAILGTAYKSEVSDSKNSPAEKIIEKLMGLGAEVITYDPYLSENFGAKKAVDLYEAVKEADCIIIATDHEQFREMNLSKIKELMREKPVIVDGRRVVNPAEAGSIGFKYYGIGIRI